ncbi:MAG: GNAT family N-acetyltransferase, partial [Phycisphaerales bacterium]|nr:GNAT family N-acetyltransferase [Phycisphaerales bacterium]
MGTLKTERLVLRPMVDGDASSLAALAGEKEIAATTTNIPHPYTEQDARSWIATHASIEADGRGVHYGIEFVGHLVGVISLMVSPMHQRAELGYWIGKPYWNKGVASEAASAMLAHAFLDLGMHRVYAY